MASNKVLEINYGTVATEPITLSDAKAYMHIDATITEDDSVIESLIISARQVLELYTNISFVKREIVAIIDNSLGSIELPMGVHDVTDLEVKNENGDTITPVVIGGQFKQLKSPCEKYLQVTFEGGYEDGELPAIFKDALLAQTAWMYQHRGDEDVKELGPQAKEYLRSRRRIFNEFFL